jgi:NADP-dependent 3-hydroxy acid dehydrogenase YdfG
MAVAGLSRSASDVHDDRYAHRTVDVTAPTYPAALPACVEAMGGVDLCVYAAGIGEVVDLTDLSAQTHTLDVNLLGAARTIEAVVPGMVAARGGHIIGLSSLADVGIFGDTAAQLRLRR